MTKYSLDHLVDLDRVQSLLQIQYKITGLWSGILDLDQNILVAEGWQDICTRFHRAHPVANARCLESNEAITDRLQEFEGSFRECKCKNGLWAIAMPIIIDGKMVATFFTGQFFYDDDAVDESFFRDQAVQFGIDQEAYIEALRRVPVFTREQIRNIMEYYRNLVEVLAESGLKKLKLEREVEERIKAEHALRETEQRFKSYFDLNLVGMVTITEDNQWLEINDKFCEIVGYSREELQGKTWRDLVHADDLQSSEDVLQELYTGKIDHTEADVRHIRKDGSLRHVLILCKALRRPQGSIDRLVIIAQDITHRKQTEEALRLDEARLEALLTLNQMGNASVEETVNYIVSSAIRLTKSKSGYLAYVNEAENTLIKHGWSRGSLQECKLKKRAVGHSIEQAGLWAESVRHKKPIIINDYSRPQLIKKGCPQGHIALDRFMAIPLLEKDKVVAVIGVGNKAENYDDTDLRQLNLLGQGLIRLKEARQAEQELLESRQDYKRLSQQFRTLLDGIPDALYLLTTDRKIVWSNAAAARWLDLEVDELIGQPCYCLLDGREETCSDCPVARCISSRRTEEGLYTTRDGRILGIKAFPLKNTAGAVQNVIEMAVDITEKIRLREEAGRSGRLASLGQLAAGVAHEINNPNGVLMLNGKILEDFFVDVLPHLPEYLHNQGIENPGGLDAADLKKEIPQLITDMLDSSRRINRIVTDLKDFVRSEEKPSFEPIDLNSIIQISARLSGNVLKKSTNRFETCYAQNLPEISGNFQQMEQVIINLLVNACQALQDKHQAIRVSTYFDATHKCSVVEVSDEGRGMDPTLLPHITEPFFTTKRQTGGTGLGLSVSARIVQEHQGKLEFFSSPGRGTTVRLALPAVIEGDTL